MSDSKQAKPGQPHSNERNLMLALVLTMLVLAVTQYFTPAPPPQPKKAPAKAAESKTAPGAAAPTAQAGPAAATGATPAAERIAAGAEQNPVIETDLCRVEFSNRGAVVKSWVLKKFKDSNGKPLNLVHAKLAGKTNWPFALEGPDWKPVPVLNEALWQPALSTDKLSIDFEFSDGANYGKKSFRFSQGKYVSEFESAVRERGVPVAHFAAWRGGFGDGTVIGAAATQKAVFYDANAPASAWFGTAFGTGRLNQKTAADAAEAPQVNRGAYTFAGLSDNYFAAVALPEASSDFRLTAVSNSLANQLDAKVEGHVGALIGGETANKFPLFVGPKDMDVMRGISPRLETLIDWGTWFGWAAKPLFAVLHWVHDQYVHNWGWSIVLVTILINVATVPSRISGLKSSRKMAALQPELKKLQDRYKGLAMSDPRRAKQNEETMALYSKHGINPISGCIPQMLILPVAIAFYTALTTVIELRGAEWLWVKDLSRPETLAIHVLPVLMLISQLAMMKFSPTPGGDQTQQRMMMLMMPVMLVMFMYQAASGLVLYWLTSNVVGIVQQLIFNRFAPVTVPAVAAPAKKK